MLCAGEHCSQSSQFECVHQMLLRCSHLSASLTVDAVAPADGPELGLEITDDLDVDY